MKLKLFSKENGLTTGLAVIALCIVELLYYRATSGAFLFGVLLGLGLIVWHFWPDS